MRSLAVCLSGFLIAGSYSLPVDGSVKVPVVPDGVIAVDIAHQFRQGRLGKRDSNSIYGSYVIVFGAGTPSQTQVAIVDTGSSDLWLNGPYSGEPQFYNPANSSSYQYVAPNFHISYGSGEASGYWAADNLNIAGSTLKNQTLGVVFNRGAGEAVFGVGMLTNEASEQPYANVPQNLVDQGLIKSNSYSVYIDNLSQSTGRILFGGVDSAKYNGTLQEVPITDNVTFYVDLDSIEVGSNEITGDKMSVMMDTGTTFCYLPQLIADEIAQQFDGEIDNKTGLYFVNEDPASVEDKAVTFNFSGATITVPSKEILVEASAVVQGNPPAPYVLGVVGTAQMPYILGDTFLRSAYAVFDLDRHVIALAQASYNSNANISLIASDGIPGAVPAVQSSSSMSVASSMASMPPMAEAVTRIVTILTIAAPSPTMLQDDVSVSAPVVAATTTTHPTHVPWWHWL